MSSWYYTLVKEEIEAPAYKYDDETINFFEERREEYISSSKKGYTIDESMEHVKNELKTWLVIL